MMASGGALKAQGEKNYTDEKGLKQGYWEQNYPDGKIQYRGTFKDGRPTGEFIRYFSNGNRMAEMNFCSQGIRADASLFFEDGSLAARGVYHEEKKDSIWKYFSRGDSLLKSMETYDIGVKSGLTVIYYANGKPFETFWYEDDIKNGPWMQYYDSGKMKIRAGFTEGKKNGSFEFFSPDGNVEIKGLYHDNLMNGDWVFYDNSQNIISTITYINGIPDNEEELIDKEQDLFRRIEEMRGKIPEPDESDVFFPGR